MCGGASARCRRPYALIGASAVGGVVGVGGDLRRGGTTSGSASPSWSAARVARAAASRLANSVRAQVSQGAESVDLGEQERDVGDGGPDGERGAVGRARCAGGWRAASSSMVGSWCCAVGVSSVVCASFRSGVGFGAVAWARRRVRGEAAAQLGGLGSGDAQRGPERVAGDRSAVVRRRGTGRRRRGRRSCSVVLGRGPASGSRSGSGSGPRSRILGTGSGPGPCSVRTGSVAVRPVGGRRAVRVRSAWRCAVSPRTAAGTAPTRTTIGQETVSRPTLTTW